MKKILYSALRKDEYDIIETTLVPFAFTKLQNNEAEWEECESVRSCQRLDLNNIVRITHFNSMLDYLNVDFNVNFNDDSMTIQ